MTIPDAAPGAAAPAPSVAAAAQRVLLFAVAGQVYGCEIDVVREIVPNRRATRLPGAPAFVRGLINLRGTLVTVIDLGLRLGRESSVRPESSIVLAEHEGKLVGVIVDDLMDVQPLLDSQVEPAAERDRGGIVRGLGHLPGLVVVLLDMHALVTHVLL